MSKQVDKSAIEHIALLNFGGIGDEILFSPVIHAVRQAFPEALITLVLEARSARIKELLPEIDFTVELDITRLSRPALFAKLLRILRGRHFDAVIASGSSPFIPVLLGLSGAPIRIGFDTGSLSQKLLTDAAPLNRSVYAGDMYFSLAKTFLKAVGEEIPSGQAIPKLSVDHTTRQRIEERLAEQNAGSFEKRILVHPGVSRMSVEKNILKSWPVSHWKLLMTDILMRHPECQIMLAGGPDDADVIATLEAFGKSLPEPLQGRFLNFYGQTTSLRELAALIDLSDVLISVDSAPMHVAVGLQTPVVTIFTATDEKKLLPLDGPFRVASRSDLACRPCLWDVRQTSCDKPVCLEVKTAHVLEQVEAIIGPATISVSEVTVSEPVEAAEVIVVPEETPPEHSEEQSVREETDYSLPETTSVGVEAPDMESPEATHRAETVEDDSAAVPARSRFRMQRKR